MRDTFFTTLEELMDADDRIIFITADMGFKLFDKIKRKHPKCVINVGIREAAMIGLAAGLAKEGFLPFVYSIIPFATLRCIEQIRVDLCYNKLPTVIVGIGGGLAYGPNGPTHMGIDDIGVMNALSGMTIVSPCDPVEVRALMPQMMTLRGPAYLRLARNGEPVCHKNPGSKPRICHPSLITGGKDAVIISYGSIVHDIMDVINELKEEGKASIGLVSCHTIKPLEEELILGLMRPGMPVIVIEEQFSGGGLGSQLALIFKENAIDNSFFHMHLPDDYPSMCGSRDYLLERGKLSRACIKNAVAGILKNRGKASHADK